MYIYSTHVNVIFNINDFNHITIEPGIDDDNWDIVAYPNLDVQLKYDKDKHISEKKILVAENLSYDACGNIISEISECIKSCTQIAIV